MSQTARQARIDAGSYFDAGQDDFAIALAKANAANQACADAAAAMIKASQELRAQISATLTALETGE